MTRPPPRTIDTPENIRKQLLKAPVFTSPPRTRPTRRFTSLKLHSLALQSKADPEASLHVHDSFLPQTLIASQREKKRFALESEHASDLLRLLDMLLKPRLRFRR